MITINAPELANAINNLATALSKGSVEIAAATAPAKTTQVAQTASTPAVPTNPAPATQTPAQNAPAPAVPVAPAPTAQQPQAPAPSTTPAPAPATVPTAAQTYTMEQLAVAATQLVDAGRREELVQLLASFGVQALTALPKEQYGAFATQLRAMGAKI